MLLRNKRTGKVENIKDITVRYHGSFTDLVNKSTVDFFYHNSHPKIFFLELEDEKGNISQRKYNMTSTQNLHGLFADIRFRLLGKQGYKITRFRTFYKPQKLIKDEEEFLTYGVIQDPIIYTVIFDNNPIKPNE